MLTAYHDVGHSQKKTPEFAQSPAGNQAICPTTWRTPGTGFDGNGWHQLKVLLFKGHHHKTSTRWLGMVKTSYHKIIHIDIYHHNYLYVW